MAYHTESQSVEKLLNKKFLKFPSNLMQRLRVDLKTYLGLAMPTNSAMLSQSKGKSYIHL